jgi:hypothetical protein
MRRATITCSGRCDGLGDLNPNGSYVRLIYKTIDCTHHIVISEGEAEALVAELQGAGIPVTLTGRTEPAA